MSMTQAGVLAAKLRTPEGQKLFRYSMASVVSVAVSLVLLVFFNGLLAWSAVWSSTAATGISALPSYEMNRRWAWGKVGKSHLWKEVVPFWALAFIGWGFSTYSVKLVETAMENTGLAHLVRTGIIAVVYVAAFGVLWVAKFIIFNKILFAHHPGDLPPALDGRSGVPS